MWGTGSMCQEPNRSLSFCLKDINSSVAFTSKTDVLLSLLAAWLYLLPLTASYLPASPGGGGNMWKGRMLVTSRPVLVPPWLQTKPSHLPNKEVKTKWGELSCFRSWFSCLFQFSLLKEKLLRRRGNCFFPVILRSSLGRATATWVC